MEEGRKAKKKKSQDNTHENLFLWFIKRGVILRYAKAELRCSVRSFLLYAVCSTLYRQKQISITYKTKKAEERNMKQEKKNLAK